MVKEREKPGFEEFLTSMMGGMGSGYKVYQVIMFIKQNAESSIVRKVKYRGNSSQGYNGFKT